MFWKDKYRLGVTLIDREHQELFQRVEAFMKILRSTQSWEDKVHELNETLEFMKGYVVEHFSHEEEYQKKIGYPGLEAHKKKHDDMVQYVAGVSEQYEKSGFDEQLMQQFGGRLLAWLVNHVAVEDQRIASYAIEQGVAGDEI
ncbi:MAG: bacteriohemerythrin [Oscillospiraceae bacterium]|jgi:hemerythrin